MDDIHLGPKGIRPPRSLVVAGHPGHQEEYATQAILAFVDALYVVVMSETPHIDELNGPQRQSTLETAGVEAAPGADPPEEPSVVTGQPVYEEPETVRALPTHTMAELVLIDQSLISELAIAGSYDDKEDLGMRRPRYLKPVKEREVCPAANWRNMQLAATIHVTCFSCK